MNKQKLLQLYFDAGIDEVISTTSVNRLKKEDKVVLQTINKVNKANHSDYQKPNITNQNDGFFNKISTSDAISKLSKKNDQLDIAQPLIPITKIIAQAKIIAESCQNLTELEKAVRDFDGCSLKKMATNTIFADGNANSLIMIIGEAPGNNEDLQGIPFCGDSGKLLNSMFGAIGFKREDLYVTNTIFWRPPGNRRPSKDELAMCQPFVEKHIALMKPKLIVLMGATAMTDILQINEPISKVRGKFLDYQNCYLAEPIKTTVLFHPSYLMRKSSTKRDAWADLLMIKEFFG
jgi:DNA polymerase